MTTAKKILLDELNEQGHPEQVENVIFWALEHYANSEPKGTWGRTIAYAIKERILEVEKIDTDIGAVGKNKTLYNLFLELGKKTREELQNTDIVINTIEDEYFSNVSFETCDDGVLDDGHFYLKVNEITED